MEPKFEQPPADGIFSRERIIEELARFAEGATFLRELSDADGLYLFEMTIPGKKEGETVVFTYQRKGTFPNSVSSSASTINRSDVDATGGVDWSETIAELNPATNEWEAK